MTKTVDLFRLASIDSICELIVKTSDGEFENDGFLLLRGLDTLMLYRDQGSLTLYRHDDVSSVMSLLNPFGDVETAIWRPMDFQPPGKITQIQVVFDNSAAGTIISDGVEISTAGLIGVCYSGDAGELAINCDFDCVQAMSPVEFQSHIQRHYSEANVDRRVQTVT